MQTNPRQSSRNSYDEKCTTTRPIKLCVILGSILRTVPLYPTVISRLPQRCRRRHRSPGMWRRGNRWLVPDASRQHIGVIFNIREVQNKYIWRRDHYFVSKLWYTTPQKRDPTNGDLMPCKFSRTVRTTWIENEKNYISPLTRCRDQLRICC